MTEFFLNFVTILCTVLYAAVLGRVLLSWFNIGPSSPFFPVVKILNQITEPILHPIRRILPSMGMFDFSPIVAIILIDIVRRLLPVFYVDAKLEFPRPRQSELSI